MHPLNGLDHLLAMAVGLWGAVLGRPLVHALPVVFPQMMVVGGILGILAVPLLSIELGIALSVALALAVTWIGLTLAYFSVYPVGFYITSLAFAAYVLVRVVCSPRKG